VARRSSPSGNEHGSTGRSSPTNATTKCSSPGCAPNKLRSAYKAKNPVEGRRIAEKVLASLPTCPIPEIKRLGKTLKQWREAFLAYFDTGRANNGGTEAINGLIELHRRVARGFRNREHYRLRMLLIGGGLSHPHLR
jgi:transposase